MHNVGRLDQPNIPIATLPPPSFQLLELGWSLDYIRNNPYPTRFFLVTVEWLLRNSSKDIRILYFDDRYAAFKTDDLYLFFKAHGANLVSLRLFGSEGDIINLHFQLGEMCPNLHELILPEVHALPTELRSTLPESTLEHLCFEAPVDERKVVMETIEWTMSLPKLRFITFDNPRKVYWAEKWRERCTGQVHVEWSSHRHEFKYEDLIWKSKFPRGRTIENIQRMVT
ncbi:hypothetical protein FRC03_002931 [Tulasnella sp. 419]|nr:hypothetical protein FRC03_002931 [Tulasnella sp. 419]